MHSLELLRNEARMPADDMRIAQQGMGASTRSLMCNAMSDRIEDA